MKNIPLKTSLTLIAAALAPLALAAPGDDVMHRASLAASAPAVPKFAIREFKVEGNTLLDAAAVAAAVNPFTGAERDFGDVQRAIEALEAAYKARGDGAVGVVLPEQVLESGTVLLRVVEGKLARVEVKGNQHFDTANVLASVPSLQVGAVPDVESISASLRVANENPAKKVTLQLAPGDKDGDIDRNDINRILALRGTSSPPSDSTADADSNGIININDARACTLKCTKAKCAP